MRGDAGGHADCAEGRDRLEEDLLQGELVIDDDEEGGQGNHAGAEHDDGEGRALHGRGDGAMTDHHLVLAAKLRDDGGKDDADGADLDATRRAGRSPADEHQQVVETKRRLARLAVVDGVEPGRPREHRTGQHGERPVVPRHGADGAGVVPLGDPEDQRTQQQERDRARHGEPRVGAPPEGPIPTAENPAPHLEKHGEPEAAHHDGDTDRHDDGGIPHEAHQVVAVEGEAGVVERRDGVEDALPGSRGPALGVGTEARR